MEGKMNILKKSAFTMILVIAIISFTFSNDMLQPWTTKNFYDTNDSASIGSYGPYRFTPAAIKQIKSRGMDLKDASALRTLMDPRSVDILIKYGLTHRDYDVRSYSADTLGLIGSKKAIPGLIKLINDNDATVRNSVFEALAMLKAKDAVPYLIARGEALLNQTLSSMYATDAMTLGSLCEILGPIGDIRAIPFLRKVITHSWNDEYLEKSLGAARWSLGLLNDTQSANLIASRYPNDIRPLRMLKHPRALEFARTILTSQQYLTEGIWHVDAIRVFAENGGNSSDIAILKNYLQGIRPERLGDSDLGVSLGGEWPRGEGKFILRSNTAPIFVAWALIRLGDNSAYSILDSALNGNNALAASEASRVYVRLKRTDKYDLIAKSLRRLLGRTSYDGVPVNPDQGVHSRKELCEMLASQKSPEALKLLVQILNDSNINAVKVARWAIMRYPKNQVLPLLEKQLISCSEWEKWQIATQMEIAGLQGLKILLKYANSTSTDSITRAICIRAVIRAEMPNWKQILAKARSSRDPYIQENVVRWAKSYFE